MLNLLPPFLECSLILKLKCRLALKILDLFPCCFSESELKPEVEAMFSKHGARSIRPKNFLEIPVQNRMEQKVSGNSFRKFGKLIKVALFFGNLEITVPFGISTRYESALVPLAVDIASTKATRWRAVGNTPDAK